MKQRTKIIIALAVACAGTLILGACASEAPYRDYASQGYTVTVRFDTNDGSALGREEVNFTDTFKLADVQRGVKLLSPDDSRRGWAANIERTGYFLAGWYSQRQARVDEEGNPLDEDGNPCNIREEVLDADGNPVYDENGQVFRAVSATGKTQGYSYSDRWDFDTRTFRLDNYEYKEGEVALTLYAAWVPVYSYNLYGKVTDTDEEGNVVSERWEVFASYSFNPLNENAEEDRTLPLPAWNESTGALDYGKLSLDTSKYKKTFLKAYADPEMTEELDVLKNEGSWDPETAVAFHSYTACYADWEEGIWFRISTPEQLMANAGLDNSYDIRADLDFTPIDPLPEGVTQRAWPAAFCSGTYRGTFRGNGHTISHVTVAQTNAQDEVGGLFGRIAESAVFENVKFTDITYRIESASTKSGSFFGLFAGVLSADAVMDRVEVQGSLVLVEGMYVPRRTWTPDGWIEAAHVYDLGLLTGNLQSEGITYRVDLLTEGAVTATSDALGRVTVNNG